MSTSAVARRSFVVLVLLYASAASAPFVADDIPQLAALRGAPSSVAARGPLDLYRFFDGDPQRAHAVQSRGLLPWWFDADQKLAHFRPAASALMWLDHSLFRDRPRPAHVHSLLWLLLTFVLASEVYAATTTTRTAFWATAFFVVQPTCITAVTWWCARHVLVSAAAGLAALMFFVRWRARGERTFLALAVAASALSLLGGETGLQALAFLVAYAVDEALCARRPWKELARSLAPFGLLLAAYAAARIVLDYGVAHAPYYIDPLRQPRAYLDNVGANLLPGLGGPVLAPWNIVARRLGVSRDAMLRSSVVLLALFGVAIAAARDRARPSRFFIAGALLALVPCFASGSGIRPWTLVLPCFGVAAALGAIVAGALDRTRGPVARVVLVGASLVFVSLRLVGGVWAIPTMTAADASVDREPLRYAVSPARLAAAKRLVVLRGSERVEDESPLYHDDARFTAVWRLSDAAAGRAEVRRSGDDALELRVADGALFDHDTYRSARRPLRSGDDIVLEGLRVHVLEAIDGEVRAARFTFDRPLDDPSLLFLSQGTDQQLGEVAPSTLERSVR